MRSRGGAEKGGKEGYQCEGESVEDKCYDNLLRCKPSRFVKIGSIEVLALSVRTTNGQRRAPAYHHSKVFN